MSSIRDSKSSSWGSLSNPFTDPEQDIERGIPLEELPSNLNPTTGNRDGQETRTDESQIIEKIKNGLYYCSSCQIRITAGNTLEEEVWQCGGCYNIIHLRCASTWAKSNRKYPGSSRTINYWSCPQCMQRQYDAPKATCWCGKQNHADRGFMDDHVNTDMPNGCQSICGKVGECTHSNRTRACDKTCHPGPCNSPCGNHCVQRPALVPKANAPLKGCQKVYQKLRTRWGSRKNKGQGWTAWLWFCFVILYYLAWAIFANYHTKWWTQPLNYRHIIEMNRNSNYYMLLAMIGGISGTGVVLTFLFFCGLVFYKRVTHLLNCHDLSTKKHCKQLTKLGIWLFIAIISGGCIAIGPLLLNVGVDLVWYKQMKNSCDGLDTQTHMGYGNGNFKFQSTTGNAMNQSFSLASRYSIQQNSPESFEYFERFSGGSDIKRNHFVVDVDVPNSAWRLLRTSGPDLANDFLANGFNRLEDKHFPKMPATQIIYSEQIKNGTFYGIKSPTDNSRPRHMSIPELNFYIANMYDFMYEETYEPFLRVFRSFGRSEEEMLEAAEQKWTDKNDASVMMRTASFGYGRGPLTMCMREGQFDRYGGNEMQESVSEDMLITFAVITAHWKKVKQTELREEMRHGDNYGYHIDY